MNGQAVYRILSDFRYTPSTGVIQSGAGKKAFMNSDSNYIEEAPPGNIDFYAANGTHSRLILMRGSFPLYSCLVSVVTHSVQQNPYDNQAAGGYLYTDPDLEADMVHEPLRMAPGSHFDCKLVFLSKHVEQHTAPNYGN